MIKNIQALRALAAIMVIFVHLKILCDTIHLNIFGGSAVDMFFVLSGYIMVHTTQRSPTSPFEFIRNRIARVVPLYWLMTIFVFTISILVPYIMQSTTGNLVELEKSLFFIPYIKKNGFVEPILFVGWTLNYEILFYTIFALGLFIRNYIVGLISIAIFFITITAVGFILKPKNVIAIFYTNSILLEFVFGMGIAFLTERAPKTVPPNVKRLAICCLVAMPALFAIPAIWPRLMNHIECGALAAIVVMDVVLLERWGVALKNKIVFEIGNASYALYLSHPFVTQIFQLTGKKLHSTGIFSIFLIVISVISVICVAVILHRVVEKPLVRVARKVLSAQRLQPRPA